MTYSFCKQEDLLATFHHIISRSAVEITHDITAHQRAEEQLLSHANILPPSSDAIITTDLRFIITAWDQAAEALYGWNTQEAVGQPLAALLQTAYIDDQPQQVLQQCLAQGRWQGEVLQKHKDGTTIHILASISSIKDSAGAAVGVVAVNRDITARKRAEATLRAREERFRRFFELGLSGMAIIAPTTGMLEANGEICAIFGYDRSELLQTPWAQLTHPDDRAADAVLFNQILAGKIDGYTSEQRGLHKDGQTIHASISMKCQRRPNGSVEYCVALVQDITARKRAEERLRAAEIRYRTLVECIPALMYIAALDETSSTIYVSPQVEALLGFSQTEWMADPSRWLQQLYPHDRDHVLATLARSQASDRPVCSEFRMLTRAGQVIWFRDEAVVVRNEAGQPLFLQGVMVDITGLKQAEEALRDSEELYRLITENTGELISVLDVQGQTLYASPSFWHLLGYDPAALLGKSRFDLVHPDDLPGLHKAWAKLATQAAIDATLRYRHADGSWRWIESHTTLVARQDGYVLVSVSHDITERKRIDAHLLQAQKMETVGNLAGGIAHDFNNMLSVIIGFIGSAQEQLGQDNPAQHDLKVAETAAWRAAKLTRQLLAFARKQVVEPQMLNLNQLIGEFDHMLRRLIDEDIDLIVISAPDLGQIKADAGQIEQVITNLIVNARDAMPQGGRLTIETSNTILNSTFISQHGDVSPGDYVLLTISDSGIGMTEATQARIFEPFFTTKEIGKGTGLGLAICYGIIRQAGGHIWVYSEIGQGTTFKIYLPRVHDATDTVVAKVERAVVPTGTETVLLVEDEPLVRELANKMLLELGYTVLTAVDGVEAWRILQSAIGATIDLLITDVVMPQMGGKALTEQVLRGYPRIKVLFISGYATDSIAHHGRLNPGTHFLSKPFTRATFARKIRAVLNAELSNSDTDVG
jgi:PAS domain S-box-containing protein